ncbi:hypothetical protein HKBW3S06_01727, partial [Candidatus Hakubella thermalkaliphila]
IREATEAKVPIFLKGNLMGGGACVEAITGHLRAGLEAYATPLAAKSIRDNPGSKFCSDLQRKAYFQCELPGK